MRPPAGPPLPGDRLHKMGAAAERPGIAKAVGGLRRTRQQGAPAPWSGSGAYRLLGSGQWPAARYASITSALMRPRGETSMPFPFAQARTAAGSTAAKAGLARAADWRREPETL